MTATATGGESAAIAALRSRGDARQEAGRIAEAKAAWQEALVIAKNWLDDPRAEQLHTPGDRANFCGIRGGLERRLGKFGQALESYRLGAQIEKDADLASTYNRTNAIKLALITGEETVADLHQKLLELRNALQRRSDRDERVKDDAWRWADLGDVQLLLGDDGEAVAAYRTFTDKAQSTSPDSTLRVVKEVAAALKKHGDDAADRVGQSVAAAEQVLTS